MQENFDNIPRFCIFKLESYLSSLGYYTLLNQVHQNLENIYLRIAEIRGNLGNQLLEFFFLNTYILNTLHN